MRTLLEKILKNNYDTGGDFELKKIVHINAKSAVAVDCTPVSEYIESLTGMHLYSKLFECTPQRLPFPTIWMEWPCTMIHGDGEESPGKAGALLYDLETETIATYFIDTPYYSSPMVYGVLNITSIDGGKSINDIGITRWRNRGMLHSDDDIKEDLSSHTKVISHSLAFFNCKNVSLKVVNNRKHNEKTLKKFGIYVPSFHVIEIHKNMVRREGDHIIRNNKPTLQHARLIRGHFKTYEDDSKLFGKITGTFFWESHVRGTVGAPIVSDYRVWPPSEEHKPICTVS